MKKALRKMNKSLVCIQVVWLVYIQDNFVATKLHILHILYQGGSYITSIIAVKTFYIS